MSDSESDAFQSADEGEEDELRVVKNVVDDAPPAKPKSVEKAVKSNAEVDAKPVNIVEEPVEVKCPVETTVASRTSVEVSEDALGTKVAQKQPLRVPKVSKLGLKKGASASTKPASNRLRGLKLGAQRSPVEEKPVVDSLGDLSMDDEVVPTFEDLPERLEEPAPPSSSQPTSSRREVIHGNEWNTPNESTDGWSSWTSWGTSVVSTFTHQVASGITTVKEVVESGLGIPDPEELARSHVEAKKEKLDEGDSGTQNENGEKKEINEEPKLFSLFGGALSAGSQILSGGLGTLEYIGKKTVEVLQENDPGLRKKREFLQGKQPTLSDMLMDARKTSELPSSKTLEDRNTVTAVFEELGGLTHFEALSSLKDTLELNYLTSGEGDGRLKLLFDKYSFKGDSMDEDHADDEIDEEKAEFKEVIESMANFLEILDFRGVNGTKVLAIQSQMMSLDDSVAVDSIRFQSYMRRLLASLAAAHVEILHRIAEALLLLNDSNGGRSARSLLPTVFQLARCFVSQYEAVAAELSNGLKDKNEGGLEPIVISRLVKETYQEAISLTSWVREAYELVKAVMRILAANEGKRH